MILAQKKKNVPVLRFPEFQEEWDSIPIEQIFTEITVGFVGTVSNFYCKKNEGIEFIRTLNVRNGYFDRSNVVYVTHSFHNKNKKSEIFNDDILIARVGANMGDVCKVSGLSEEANCANVIIIKKSVFNCSDFYALYLSSVRGQRQIQAKGAGGAQEVLNVGEAVKLNVPKVGIAEQQKIADFLIAVDERIQQLTRKKELLELYKKGVMQQLFSQQIRFKDDDGNDYPDWEEKRLGEVVVFIKNGTSAQQHDSANGQKVTRIETIWNWKIDINRVGCVANDVSLKDYKLEIGDLLFSNINSVKHIGKMAIVDKDYNLYHGMNLLNIRLDNSNQYPHFYYYLLTSNKYKSYFEKICNQAVSQASINQTDLKKTIVNVPTMTEQKKIADFLSGIDDKINSVQIEIEQTQLFKKGLLQQMFC